MFHRSPRRGLVIAAVLLAACARDPATSGRALDSAAREAEAGARMAAQVEATMGLVDAPAVEAYVADMGVRLAAHSPRRDVVYRFAVVDVAEPHAFALPGGWIFVSRGLLALANDEDELANVLGHEIAHVAARHAAERRTRSLPVGILAGLDPLVGGAVPGDSLGRAVGALPEFTDALILARYDRDQEREADELGQEMAARAGWDPAGLPAFFETLARVEARRPPAAGAPIPRFFASHPDIPERIADNRERAAGLERGPGPRVPREAFLERLDGLRVGENPAEGVFRDALFLHPDLDFALGFPSGWTLTNTREAVSALSPERDALLLLKLQQVGDDPHAAAVDFARRGGLTLTRLKRVEVNGLPAVRGLAGVRGGSGTFVADYTFVAHRGYVFRITGVAPLEAYDSAAGRFADAARSFRPLEPEERAGIRSRRLRLARPRAGEDFAAFSRRTGNAWTAGEFALANGLEPGAPLEPRLVKIARDEAYRGAVGDAPPARPAR